MNGPAVAVVAVPKIRRAGDVKLGPRIYKTRAAIGRTIAGVHETFIEAPFLWYGRVFLKLTGE